MLVDIRASVCSGKTGAGLGALAGGAAGVRAGGPLTLPPAMLSTPVRIVLREEQGLCRSGRSVAVAADVTIAPAGGAGGGGGDTGRNDVERLTVVDADASTGSAAPSEDSEQQQEQQQQQRRRRDSVERAMEWYSDGSSSDSGGDGEGGAGGGKQGKAGGGGGGSGGRTWGSRGGKRRISARRQRQDEMREADVAAARENDMEARIDRRSAVWW